MTLVIFYNFNLPLDKCYKTKNIFISFILPSPNIAKDLDSFLQPLVDKLLELECSI